MIEGGGGGESKLLKVPRASKQNPTLDQKLTIPQKTHVVPVIST